MAVVKLSSMPSPHKTRSLRFPTLDGGLNLRDAEINLKANESPEIVNLWLEGGVLKSRPGQEAAASGWGDESASGNAFSDIDTVYAVTEFPEGVLAHIGAFLYTWHGDFEEWRRVSETEIPRNAGTFFRFGADLYYKNAGGFYKLSYDETHASDAPPFALSNVADGAFVPTILINADPATGSGDAYQPENRLSPKKRVTYNANTDKKTVIRTANGVLRAFFLFDENWTDAEKANLRGVSSVYVNDEYKEPALYSFDARTGTVLFNSAPPDGATITFTPEIGNREYHLPVANIGAVTEVKLWNGGGSVTLTEGQHYTVDAAAGIVTFAEAPPVTDPPTNNTVEIVYSKENPEALSGVMNCPYAAVYGTGQDLCVVVGGGNTLFWSGSTQYGLDLTYFPFSQYNLTDDEITGFAEQYDQMFVFQRRRTGKLSMTTQEVNGRNVMSLSYFGVNDSIGCDLPHSIQLIENNLTFANTSGGVYRILSASAAYENNIQCVSEKVNGSDIRPGLLYDLRVAGQGPVHSLDDGKRYWLSVNGHVWLWDYSVSGADNPVCFYFTGLSPLAFATRDGVPLLFDAQCRAVRLSGLVFSDFGETAIRKVYQFPVRNFGSYDRLKDIRTVLFSVRADAPSDTSLIYETDYETRTDRVNLTTPGYDRLTERNLEVRDLSVPRHAATFRRDPHCRNVRHFSMRLENNTVGQDLSVFSAEILYRFAGRDR